jgi:hypothetical protein
MADSSAGGDSRRIKAEQRIRADTVRSPAFLESHVRTHVAPGSADGSGQWSTEVIQLDGSGAATVRVSLDESRPLFAKVFPFDDGPDVYAKLRLFREQGFGAGARYQTVEPLAWLDEEKVMLCRGAPGRPVSDLVGGAVDELAVACGMAGRWLGVLHASPLRIGTPQSLLVTGELVSLAKRLSKVLVQTPGYLDVALDMLAGLDRLAANTADGMLAQCHGQYRPIHVFVDGSQVTVIDLDRSSPADPARDCAEFLHHLRNSVHVATGDISRADQPCAAFLEGYREVSGSDRLGNLRFHWARYLFHTLTRKVKGGEACQGPGEDPTYRRLRSEFDRVLEGRAEA